MGFVMEYIMKKTQRKQLTLVIIVSSVDLSQDSQDLVSKLIIVCFSTSIIVIIFYPSVKTCVLGAQKNRLIETVLLSTHNICFGKKKEE